MLEYGLAILYALFIWWFSTGLILYLDGLPRRTFSWSMVVMTVIALAALYGLWVSGTDNSMGGAYLSFTCGLLVWAWHELSFLTGYLTGPRRTPCPKVDSFWARFRYASETVIHHEIAIAATAGLMAMLTWGASNQIGLWTFVILWLMRLSAKLNIFLGVANLAEEFLPPHLRYLETYFRRRPLNLLFPVSVTVSTIVTVLILERGLAEGVPAWEAVGAVFLGTLLALAVLEHWFLVLPIQATALWQWALDAQRTRRRKNASVAPGEVEGDDLFQVLPVSAGTTKPAKGIEEAAGISWGTHSPLTRMQSWDVPNNKPQVFPGRGSAPGSLD
ncbi:putative photosynthetic complex assembly protein PuhE [Dichotomicrobium thermohalophilum]|uniref:Putative photosynthetic complex assembly protein 2 n=1 Tax=Dichotomicrobium thermohalophilum TaxID=933063 RepID=A0A397Q6Q2_9HYPH|nr:putative photosynthetic complex assembly protein PuhE [Dichotomicrobium thermohalophilum]RIA56728.1 putative photosynthetic complex assembly protein 2 [Dichotomicrobium thermohalophilum]